ncbi:MAG TPA: cytochrome b/b6 domain-containing protein [Acidimicrobiales bacterium]|nr:cytochrome b/b6 domain-containing protein [Acidimicrobiales bacterium]
MATTALASPDARRSAARRLVRFDAVERLAHWCTAIFFLTLIVTGAILYVPALVGWVGRRVLITRIHVDVGLALPLPLVVSLLGSWGRGLRADLRRLNRWTIEDRQWFSALLHRRPLAAHPAGKFNAGQKLNAAFVLGEMIVMLMTGSVMHWFNLFSNSWRTGATFVHDLFAYLLVAVVVGHILMALTHPEALRSIFTGRVTREWAKRHAPLWLEETEPEQIVAGGSERTAGGVNTPR